MNTSILAVWLLVLLLSILSIILLMGKGSILIAGYNTLSKEEKQKYNTKKLCRVMGSGFSFITIILGISAFYKFELHSAIAWIIPWGILGAIAVMAILANTICLAKKNI